MPRDPNGNYTLPAGNPVVTGTLIESTWANATMEDIADALTDSLSRSGQGGFTGPLGIVDKSGSVPGLNFVAEPTSGFKREAAGDVRIQVLGQDQFRVTSGNAFVYQNGAWRFVAADDGVTRIMRGTPGDTIAFFYNNTAPPGWTVQIQSEVRALMVNGTAEIGGTVDPRTLTGSVSASDAFAVDITGNTADHALSANEMPAHTHDVVNRATSTDNQGAQPAGTTGAAIADATTSSTGGGAAHSHGKGTLAGTVTVTLSDNFTITPRYAQGILCKLDAGSYAPPA